MSVRPQRSFPASASPPAEPQAEQRPLERTLHGVRLVDEYAWLKAENWREVMRDPSQLDPAIRAYLQAENDYCEYVLADTKSLQETLFAEMKGRIKEDDSSVPKPDGPYAYYVRYRKEGQHPLLCREPRNSAGIPSTQTAEATPQEQLLLDGDALAQGKAFFRLGATRHSSDHRLLAWLADEAGSELYTARVREIDTGADLADVVPDVSGAVVWTQDASAFYYVRLDQSHRPAGVFRHALGTPVAADVRVFTEADPGFFVSVDRHSSGRFGDISAHDHETSEAWLIDLAASAAEPTLIAARQTGVQYEVEHHPAFNGGPALIIRTNADGAEDFKIVVDAARHARSGPLARSRPASPGRLYPVVHGPRRTGSIRLEREDGLPRIVVRRLASGEEHVIAFAEEAYSLGIDDGYEFATDVLRFTYSSMTTPEEVWDYDLASRQRISAQAAGNPQRPRQRRLRHATAVRAGRRRRDRSDFAPLPQGCRPRRDRRPACSTATAPTAFRSPPRSAAIGCRWSTAASSTPSPMCAAAARRAGAGIAKASSPRRPTRLPISSRRASISATTAGARRDKIVAQGGSAGGTLDRRDRQYAAGPLRRPDRRGAVRRRAQHHARRDAAAHAAGMAGMGRSDPRRGRHFAPSWPTRPTRTCARRIIRRSSRWRA